jgi:hypothetical protein
MLIAVELRGSRVDRCGVESGEHLTVANEGRSVVMSIAGRVRLRLLGIAPRETNLSYRGFAATDGPVRDRLELIGRTFVAGYHAALAEPATAPLGQLLDEIEAERRGWAYEGAGMALALIDGLTPWPSRRFEEFLAGPGAPHAYMVHVGVGWAAARLRRSIERVRRRLDPVLGWLAVDGYGFHEAYFRPGRTVRQQAVPGHLHGYACRAFDQGVGRCMWFVYGADAERITEGIAGFAEQRRGDLFSGVGLACAYAGGRDRATIEHLRDLSGPHAPHLAQGAAFAAKARQRAGGAAAHTEIACAALCGLGADEAAAVSDEMATVPAPDEVRAGEPAYERWRTAIRHRFGPQCKVAT